MPPQKYTDRKREENSAARNNVVSVVLIIISAFLLLCLITRDLILGVVGAGIANIFLGTFGYFSYAMLLFLLIFGIFKARGKSVTVGTRYVVCITIIWIAAVLIAHIASATITGKVSFGEYASTVYYGRNTVGGVLFGLLYFCLYSMVRTVASYVLLSLVIVAAIIVMAVPGKKKPFVSPKKAAQGNKAPTYASAPVRYDDRVMPSGGGSGLFVGTIYDSGSEDSEAGGYDDLPEEPAPDPDAERYDREYRDYRDYRASDEEYNRRQAHKILFEENSAAYNVVMPTRVTAEQDTGSEPEAAPPQPQIPEIHMPPRKYYENDFVAGDIINGDELTSRLEEQSRASRAYEAPTSAPAPEAAAPEETESEPAQPLNPIINADEYVGKYSPAYVPPAPAAPVQPAETEENSAEEQPAAESASVFNPGPIINGDFYVKGQELPKGEARPAPARPAQRPAPVSSMPEPIDPRSVRKPEPAPAPVPEEKHEEVREEKHEEVHEVKREEPAADKPATRAHEEKPRGFDLFAWADAQKEVKPEEESREDEPADVSPAVEPEVAPVPEPAPVEETPLFGADVTDGEEETEPEESEDKDDEFGFEEVGSESAAPEEYETSYEQSGNLVDELEQESTDLDLYDTPQEEGEEEPEEEPGEEAAEEGEEDSADESETFDVDEAEEDHNVGGSDVDISADEEIETESGEAGESEEPGEEETELSRNFEKNTTSFVISDEVEDLSERSYSNPNDTTGYYNQVSAPVSPEPVPDDPVPSFADRISRIDDRINRRPERKPAYEPEPEEPEEEEDTASFAESELPAKEAPKPKKPIKYVAPPLDLLVTESDKPETDDVSVHGKIEVLESALEQLGIPAKVTGYTQGPAVMRYELDMPPGMPVKRIENTASDIRYYLESKGQIRIESPIPGKRAVGIEVPNDRVYKVALKDIIGSEEFKKSSSPLTFALGKDIQGEVKIARLDKMPHLLIAGTTGSGKSSCLNSMLVSILYKASPEDVKLILIDPKQVEFIAYNGVPHLIMPKAITNVNQAINAFKWASQEMENRYTTLSEHAVRDIGEYNALTEVKEGVLPKMPYIVIIVDEFANLITSSPANRKTLEDHIMLITSKARAAGIHLVLATQRPSVDVITGTIRSNLPSRIAFTVASAQNSRIILDAMGAEALVGKGDMLFAPLGAGDCTRIQGAFVEEFEVRNIVNYVKEHNTCEFDGTFEAAITPKEVEKTADEGSDEGGGDSQEDKILMDVVRCVIRSNKVSASMIQRRFRFGFNRAARIIEQMEEYGFIGPQNGNNPREIYVTKEMFEEKFGVPFDE